MQGPTKSFGKTGLQLFAKKLNFSFREMRLPPCSEAFADLPLVLPDKCPPCEVLCRFASAVLHALFTLEAQGVTPRNALMRTNLFQLCSIFVLSHDRPALAFPIKRQRSAIRVSGMTRSDPNDCVGIRGSQQNAERHRLQSSVEITRAQYESVSEPTELTSGSHCHRG